MRSATPIAWRRRQQDRQQTDLSPRVADLEYAMNRVIGLLGRVLGILKARDDRRSRS